MNDAKTILDKVRALPDYNCEPPARKRLENLLQNLSTLENHTHEAFIEDVVPVPLHLKKFYDELKHKSPGITFVVTGGARHRMHTSDLTLYTVYGQVGIAYIDAPDIVVGKIMLETNNNNEPLYCVFSRQIRNERYATYNEDYNTKRTKKFKDAIKTAGQYLKPKTAKDIFDDSTDALHSAQSQIKSPAAHKLYEACSIQHPVVQQEIEAMVAFGYTPKTTQFLKAFELIRDEGEELKQVAKYKPKATFVWLKSDRAHIVDPDGVETVAHTMEDVPEDIRNKIAVLQIGTDNSAVINVGVKVDDTKYWVFA